MVLRILAVVLLLSTIGGGAWYFLRQTPAKEVMRLREEIIKLLGNEPTDWAQVADDKEEAEISAQGKALREPKVRLELARKRSNRIFEVLPNQDYDTEIRAKIEEMDGKLADALKVYERYKDSKTEPAAVRLHRALLLQKMGLRGKAEGELVGAMDDKPYEANMALGRAKLQSMNPGPALEHFRRALDAAESLNEPPARRADALANIAESINQLISRLEVLIRSFDVQKDALSEQGKSDLVKMKDQVGLWMQERDRALDEAIALLKSLNTSKASEFERVQLVLGRLYQLYDNPARLDEGLTLLGRAIADDEEGRYWSILLKLAEMRLQLVQMLDSASKKAPPADETPEKKAAREKQEPERRKQLVAQFERDFKNALGSKQFGVNLGAEQLSPEQQKPMTESARQQSYLVICEQILNTDEAWRLVEAEKDGRKDSSLGLSHEIQEIGRTGLPWSAPRAKMIRAVALLRYGKENDAEETLNLVAQEAREGTRGSVEAQIAQMCFRAKPDSMLFLKYIERGQASNAASQHVNVGTEISLLDGAVALRKAVLKSPQIEEAARKRVEGEIATLEATRKSIVDGTTGKIDQAEEYLAFAQTIQSASGADAATEVLRKGRDKLLATEPRDTRGLEVLRGILGGRLLEKAAAVELAAQVKKEEAVLKAAAWWPLYRESLEEHLAVVIEHPYRHDIFQKVVATLRKYKTAPDAPDPQLQALLQRQFPKAPEDQVRALADIFDLFALGKFGEVPQKIEYLKGARAVQPYGSLILGSALFFEGQRLAGQVAGYFPEPGKEAEAKSLRETAQRVFQEEIGRSPDYVPLRLEAVRAKLAALPPGEDVEEKVLTDLQGLIAKVGEGDSATYHVFTLQALALERRFDFLARNSQKEDASRRKLANLLLQRRTALRRAIQSSPRQPDAYAALAETYLGKGSEALGRLADPNDPSRSLLEPDYLKAVNVLQEAPQTPQIMTVIARILTRHLKRPVQAARYYEQILRIDPTENGFRGLIACYAASADPELNADPKDANRKAYRDAKDILDRFEKETLPRLAPDKAAALADFPGLKHMFNGIMAQGQMRLATTLDRKTLKQEAIEEYRKANKWYQDAKKPVPVEVANNLAWILSDKVDPIPGGLEEARLLMEEAMKSLGAGLGAAYAGAVKDTYGWILYRQGQLKEAEELYGKLVKQEPNPAYQYHYAQVLFDLKNYKDAKPLIDKAVAVSEKYEELADAQKLKGDIELKLQEKLYRDTRATQ